VSNNNPIAVIEADILGTRSAFQEIDARRLLNFEAEAGFATQIIAANDFALKTAMGNRQAVVNAVTNVAAIGLSLNPAKKLAYLVPRKVQGSTQIMLDLSYMGLIELAVSCGAILMAQARVVHERDDFVDNGIGSLPTHRYQPFGKDRGEVVGVYVAAKVPTGEWLVEMMSVDDINDIRDRSEAWKSFKAEKIKSCPWSTDWEEMAKKTVAKRASKWWRGHGDTTRLDNAIQYLNTDGGEGLADIAGANARPVTGFSPDGWIEKVRATTTAEALQAVYASAMAEAAKTRDGEGGRAVQAAARAHRDKLTATDVPHKEAA
jgi:recombination protein RecT